MLRKNDLDLHLKDIEILLRSFALALSNIETDYKGNMKRLLNEFSSKAKRYKDEEVKFCEEMFIDFIESVKELDSDSFVNINDVIM